MQESDLSPSVISYGCLINLYIKVMPLLAGDVYFAAYIYMSRSRMLFLDLHDIKRLQWSPCKLQITAFYMDNLLCNFYYCWHDSYYTWNCWLRLTASIISATPEKNILVSFINFFSVIINLAKLVLAWPRYVHAACLIYFIHVCRSRYQSFELSLSD